MALYESEHTKFIREMFALHPEWIDGQKAGRALLWDRKVDLGEQESLREASQAKRPCPCGVNFDPE